MKSHTKETSKIIFTDCFNTLILRKESEKTILFNWCERLGNLYSIEPVVIYHFFDKIKTHSSVKSFFKTGETEIKFGNIISKVTEILKQSIHNFDSKKFEEDALSTYIMAEYESFYLNETFIKQLEEYKNLGSRIYVISDFYCGKEVLEKWFELLGISNLFDGIFVSCDYMLSKRSTKLYKKVLCELHLNRKNITMFGDNSYSDIWGAKKVGIKAIKINTNKVKTPKNFKKIKTFGNNYKEFEEISNLFGKNYSYSNHAFPLFLFTRRLCKEIERKGIKNIFFLSREGMFLKKLFDDYCSTTGICNDVKSHYLEVSRNALYRVNLKPLESQDFSYLIKKLYKMSVFQFISSLSFSKEEISNIEKELGENIYKKKSHFEKSDLFNSLISTDSFKKAYEGKRLEQEGVFDKYLQSFGVDFSVEGLNLVDVGWKGSMQDLLISYLGKNINVFGWYIGYLRAPFSRNSKDKNASLKKGLLFQKANKKFANSCFKPIFLDYEQICRANRNSVYGYKLEDNKISIIYEDKLNEHDLHKKYILPLQTQIEEKFVKLCKLEYKNLSILEPISAIEHMNIYRHLSKYDVDFYVNATNSHFDNFCSIGIPRESNAIKRIGFKGAGFLLKIKFLSFSTRKIIKTYYKYISNGNINKL